MHRIINSGRTHHFIADVLRDLADKIDNGKIDAHELSYSIDTVPFPTKGRFVKSCWTGGFDLRLFGTIVKDKQWQK